MSGRSCATVLIWEPKNPENTFGHAAIQTNTYHMSLWPHGDVKRDYGYLKTCVEGIKAEIIFDQHLDYVLEGEREPLQYQIDFCSMKKINELYEEMLDYNDITRDNVTLESAHELTKKNRKPEIILKKSLYSFKGQYMKDSSDPFLFKLFMNPSSLLFEPNNKTPIKDFYKHKQSCTTFCMNLLLNAGAYELSNSLFKYIQINFPQKEIIDGLICVEHFKKIIESKFDFYY